MPKEIITGSAVPGDGPFHVKVGWTNDRDVQLGVEADGGKSLFWILMGVTVDEDTTTTSDELQAMRERQRRRLAELGAHVREVADDGHRIASDDDPGRLIADATLGEAILNTLDSLTILEYSGVWATLDRAGCNRLIRITRRARDAAYGRDE